MKKNQIHHTATTYQNMSDLYEAGRPGYTQDSVFALCDHLKVSKDSQIVELGAGTGKFTRVLLQRYSNVVAVEPVPAMLDQLKAILPEVHALLGTGEAIPLPDHSCDFILIANAFHWFCTERALQEFTRILNPKGGLGLIWNLDGVFTSSWGKTIDSWLDEIEGDTPQYKTGIWKNVLKNSKIFSDLNEETFSASRTTTAEEVVQRVMSISFVAALPENERLTFQQKIENHLATHPDCRNQTHLRVSFDTKIYWCWQK